IPITVGAVCDRAQCCSSNDRARSQTAPTVAIPSLYPITLQSRTMNYSINDHIKLKRVSSIAASPDGTWLAVGVERLDLDGAKYIGDNWKVPVDGSSPVQLTRGETNDTSPRFRHDGALGFLSNRRPNEIKPDDDADKRLQLWVLPAAGGESKQLTDEPL